MESLDCTLVIISIFTKCSFTLLDPAVYVLLSMRLYANRLPYFFASMTKRKVVSRVYRSSEVISANCFSPRTSCAVLLTIHRDKRGHTFFRHRYRCSYEVCVGVRGQRKEVTNAIFCLERFMFVIVENGIDVFCNRIRLKIAQSRPSH